MTRRLLHAAVAWLMSPVPSRGHVRLRDHVAWTLTTRIPLVARLRGWYADRGGRPGFAPREYE